MAESLKERQARLAEKLKTEPAKAPLQEVNPVAVAVDEEAFPPKSKWPKSAELVQFNVKLPKPLAKAVRQAALDDERDIREVVQDAIRQYIESRKAA
jgi:hypothetical protein